MSKAKPGDSPAVKAHYDELARHYQRNYLARLKSDPVAWAEYKRRNAAARRASYARKKAQAQ